MNISSGYTRDLRKYNVYKYAILVAGIGSLLLSYINLRFIGVVGNPFVVATCFVAVIAAIPLRDEGSLTNKEIIYILLYLMLLLAFGPLDYSSTYGYEVTINAAVAAGVLVAAYVMARALVTFRIAYVFCTVGFLLVLIPAAYNIIIGEVGRLDHFFLYGSENYVSSWLIVTSLAMCSARISEGKHAPIWPLAATFLLSLTQYTRSSIVVSLLSLILVSYFRFGFKVSLATVVAAVLVSIPFGNHIMAAITDAFGSTKFSDRGLESVRWEMWQAYLEYQDIRTVFFGTNTDYVPVIAYFGGNPHNSFIRFHAYFGIIALVWSLIYVLLRFRRSRLYLWLPPLFILARSGSDILLIGTVLDVFLMISLVPLISSKAKAGKKRSGIPVEGVAARSRSTVPANAAT